MKAWTVDQLNQPPLLVDMDVPVITENQKLININASAFNHRDVWITKGLYPGIRLGAIMGSDGAGIDEEGNRVIINPGLEWGQNEAFQSKSFRVLGVPDDGTFADYIAIDKKYVYPMPTHLSFREAAALPLGGVTAFRSIIKRAALKEGEKVLVSGVGGGVALFAMQFALALNCEVYVTSGNEEKIQSAIDLGAKDGFLYSDIEWSKKIKKLSNGIDVIVDSAGGSGFKDFVDLAAPGGRIVFYGGTRGNIDGLNPQRVFWKQLNILGSTMGSDLDFKEMLDFVNQHKVKPFLNQVYGFDDFMAGFNCMTSGSRFGKIVIDHSI